jgi:hypothetical protein
MFNPKMESGNKKVSKSLPKYNVFCFFIFCALKYHAAPNFLIDGPQVAVKASKMAVVFGECVRECFSGPGNTESSAALVVQQ